MALYVGETILIKHSATFDGTVLTAADMQIVTIIIYHKATEVVVEDTIPMVWNATKVRWEHFWDTSPQGATPAVLDPGTYLAKVYTLSVDGAENWEYKKIKLKVNPI